LNPEILSQLRDIQGLDPVSWWPLATGWWLLMLLTLVLIVGFILWLRNLRKYPPGSWNRDAYRSLMRLKKQAPSLSDSEVAGQLSGLLRRIAVIRLGRLQAAGLSGDAWLSWLHEQDPQDYDWLRKGRLLLTLPYAPPTDSSNKQSELLELLRASIAWTEKR
jgi:hypothetical protein